MPVRREFEHNQSNPFVSMSKIIYHNCKVPVGARNRLG